MNIYEVVEQFGLAVKEVQSNVYEVVNSNIFTDYKGLQYSLGCCSMLTSDSCKSSTGASDVSCILRKIYYIFIYDVPDDVISYYERCVKDMYNNDVLYSAYSGECDSYSAVHIDTIYSKEELSNIHYKGGNDMRAADYLHASKNENKADETVSDSVDPLQKYREADLGNCFTTKTTLAFTSEEDRKFQLELAETLRGKTTEEKFYFMIRGYGECSDKGLVLLTQQEAEFVESVLNSDNWICRDLSPYIGCSKIDLSIKYPVAIIDMLREYFNITDERKDDRDIFYTLEYMSELVTEKNYSWEQVLSDWKERHA